MLLKNSDSDECKKLLQKVIRSQILHLVDQLAETGEESFMISATGEDEVPHIVGSKYGLVYMQGFRGVQDGFPNFIQKNIHSQIHNSETDNGVSPTKQMPSLERFDNKEAGINTSHKHNIISYKKPGISKTTVNEAGGNSADRIDELEKMDDKENELAMKLPAADDVGSARTSGINQGFRGVQDGFPNILQKNHELSQKRQLKRKREVEKCTAETKEMRSVDKVVRFSPDSVKSARTNSMNAQTLLSDNNEKFDRGNVDASACVDSCSKEVHETNSETEVEIARTRQDVLQERQSVSKTTSIPMEHSVIPSRIHKTNIGNSAMKQVSDPERFTERDEDHETSLNTNSIPNDKVVAEKVGNLVDDLDELDEDQDDMSFDDDMNSDDKETDSECDESEFDEFKKEEIFSKLIYDFKNIKNDRKAASTRCSNIVEENVSNHAGEASKTENQSQVSREEDRHVSEETVSEMQDTQKENTGEIEDTNEVKLVFLNKCNTAQGYMYKNKVYRLSELISPGNLKCQYCNKSCRGLKEVREHQGSHSKIYTCFRCDQNLPSLAKLREHHVKCYTIPKFVKDIFRKNSNFCPKPRLVNHEISPSISKPDEKQCFKCKTCFKKFSFRFSLKKHLCKQVVTDENVSRNSWKSGTGAEMNVAKPVSFKAEIASLARKPTSVLTANFNSGQNIKTNENISDIPMKRYKCQYCQKKFLTHSHLNQHIVVHTGAKNLKCSLCSETFRRREHFINHKTECKLKNPGKACLIIRLHNKDEKNNYPVKGDFNEDKQLEGANKQLKGDNKQLEGADNQLKGDYNQLKGADKQLEGANKQLEGANKQLEGADNQLKGDYNQLKGANKQLEGANKQVEGNNKQLEGNKQLKGNNKQLEGNNKQQEGNDKQLKGADKQPEGADKQREGDDKHIKGDGVKTASVSDNKIKKFNCTYCDKSFTRNANLRDHIVLHTGEKNLKCSVCLKAFLTRTKFVKHKEECEFENPGEICKIMRLNGKNLSKEPLNQDNNHEKKVQEDNDIDGGPDNLNSCTEVNMPNGEENILGSQGIIRNDSDAKKNDVGNSQRAENMFDFGNILNDLSNFLSERMFDTDLNVS